MIIVNEKEVRSTIGMWTKNKDKGLTHVIINRHGEPLDAEGKSVNPVIMGICNADQSVIIPMFNWDIDFIKMYIKSARYNIDIMSDTEFAFYYTPNRVVTWRQRVVKDLLFMDKTISKYNKAVQYS